MDGPGRVNIPSSFGALLRRYRLAAGLSQQSLAEHAGMSIYGISALERGYRKTPQFETLTLLARALGFSEEQRREFVAAAQPGAALGRRSVTVGPWPSLSPTNLPLALARFVGREAELDEIAGLLDRHRLVTLTGAGGIGKTQTALRAAIALSDETSIAVCFVGLSPIREPLLVATTIANALGVQEVSNHPMLETLVAFLKKKSTLLVLDNCEHVIAEVANIAGSLLAACPALRVLATSREPLMTAGEHRYRLPSLHEGDATALFVDRAVAADAHFVLTDQNGPIIGTICARLSGIPLAIELAAARVTVLPLNALAQELENCLGVLICGDRAALPRQRTMRAAIDWSYNLLSAAERQAFERLSIFVGGCTLDTAVSVCASEELRSDEVLNVIASLADKSLVVADVSANEPRYRLLEPFRQYASERLVARGDQQVVAHRHARVYLEVAHRFRNGYEMDSAAIIRHGLAHQDADNWCAALRWALRERGDVVLGQHLACAAPLAAVEKRKWIWYALELVDAATPVSLAAELRYEEALMARVFFERETQLASSELAIFHYREAGDRFGVLRAQGLAGFALLCLGRTAEATSVLQTALATARTLGDRFHAAYLLRGLGGAASARGDNIAARRNIEEALHIYEDLDAQAEIPWALDDLSEVEFCAGRPRRALRHSTEMLRIVRELNQGPLSYAHALSSMSLHLLWLDRFAEAAHCARQALDLALEYSLPFLTAWNIHHLAAIAALRTELASDSRLKLREQAALLLGFVDARLTSSSATPEAAHQLEHVRVTAALNDALGMNAAARLRTEGAKMSEDEAVVRARGLSNEPGEAAQLRADHGLETRARRER